MIKSPLRYPGGKSKAIKYIDKFIPHTNKFIEPFFGGGSMSIYYSQINANATFIVSDLNYDLYCFWNQLKTNANNLIAGIQLIKNTYKNGKELYSELILRRESGLSELQRGIDFFVLNRITFSGLADSGGYSEESFVKRFTLSSIDRLGKVSPLLCRFNMSCDDFGKVIDICADDTFMFLDPPYYSVTKSRLYGKDGILHTAFDHERLYSSLMTCKCKFLMTYDNCEYIKDMYKQFNIVEWNLQYGMNNYKQATAKIGKELIIANYELNL